MNTLERLVDRIDPELSAWLRILKHRRGDPFVALLRRLVAPGSVVVDVGAHRGTYTLFLASLVGRAGRVHAVEPLPRNVRALRTLARRHPSITVHPCALSDVEGHAELNVPVHRGRSLDALASLERRDGAPTTTVVVTQHTLDGVLADEERPVQLVKCDVEGHEDRVLDGGWARIERDRPVVLVEIEHRHRGSSPDAVVAEFEARGYRAHFVTDGGPRPYAEFDLQHHQLQYLTPAFVAYSMPPGYVGDFLFVPNENAWRP